MAVRQLRFAHIFAVRSCFPVWITTVQKADSSSLSDALDTALQSGSPEKRAAMPSQAVRSRRLSGTPPEFQDEVSPVPGAAVDAVDKEAGRSHDFQTAKPRGESRLLRFLQVREVSASSA